MKMKRCVAFLLSLALLLPLAGSGLEAFAEGVQPAAPSDAVSAESAPEQPEGDDAQAAEGALENAGETLAPQTEIQVGELKPIEDVRIGQETYLDVMDSYAQQLEEWQRQLDEIVPVIVMLEEPSVIDQGGNAADGTATIALSEKLESQQAVVIAKIEEALDGRDLEITRQYTLLLNGFATSVRLGDIAAIEGVDGVKSVAVQRVFHTTGADVPAAADPSAINPMSNSDGPMIGRSEAWDNGYLGKGMKIAVIDTGLDITHKNFQPLGEDQLEDPTTQADVQALLDAGSLHAQGSASSLYRNTKVPFGYNYIDENDRIDHQDANGSEHGTHVAGIAAANDIGDGGAEGVAPVTGVAPNAQLFVLKVFGQGDGVNTGAYEEDILAALEDALTLGADVINMSLGSDAGFTSEGREELDSVYNKVSATGAVLAASAGNSGSSGEGNLWGTDTNLSSNPDNSTVGSPSTYGSSLSVASVNNVATTGYYIEAGGRKYVYTDTGGEVSTATGQPSPNPRLITVGGQSYSFASVGNFGATPEDFTNANVSGKIALVQRGGNVNFTVKADNAASAGAVACIVYNNTDGTFGMDLGECKEGAIPCVSVTQAVGEALVQLLQSEPNAKIFVSNTVATMETDDGYTMSDFSAWGVAPDLTLKPDITAPGGNIYSTLAGNQYGTMSGTSMAAPNLAGITALVKQYVKRNYPERLGGNHNFINSLLMSTASPLTAGDGLYYSPRQQGSGLANASSAIKTRVTLAVEGKDRPKIEMLDDPELDGLYNFSFLAENFGEGNAYYSPRIAVQTEKVERDDDGTLWMGLGPAAAEAVSSANSPSMIYTYDYNDNTKTNSHDAYLQYRLAKSKTTVDEPEKFRYEMTGDDPVNCTTDDVQVYLDELVQKDHENIDLAQQVLRVKAGETAAVNVSIQLTDAGKQYMNDNFPNGIYVDGFAFLDAKPGTPVSLSLPYLGFYGDWTRAPSIDSAFYWDPWGMQEEGAEPTGSMGVNKLWSRLGVSYILAPGMNPYLLEPFDMDHISVSPNGDMYMDNILYFQLSLLRNVGTLNVTYKNHGTGEVLDETEIQKVSKTIGGNLYNSLRHIAKPYAFDGLESGTKVDLSISAKLDYEPTDGREVQEDNWTTTITVDTKAPEVTSLKLEEQDDQYILDVTATDEVGISMLSFGSIFGTSFSVEKGFDEVPNGIYQMSGGPIEVKDENGQLVYSVESEKNSETGLTTYTARFNVTPFVEKLGETVVLYMEDYASNTSAGYFVEPAPKNFWQFTTDDAGDVSIKSAVYRPSDNLVFALGEDDYLYAYLPDGSNHVKIGGEDPDNKNLKERIQETAQRLNEEKPTLHYETDLELEGVTVNGKGNLCVLAVSKNGTAYVYLIDPRLDKKMIDEFPQQIPNVGKISHLNGLNSGASYDFAFVCETEGGKQLMRWRFYSQTPEILAELGELDVTGMYSEKVGSRLHLYFGATDGNVYRVDVNESTKIFQAGTGDLYGEPFNSALTLYPEEPTSGELPEWDLEDPETVLYTFDNTDGHSYRFAAAYDSDKDLVYAVDYTDSYLYAIQPEAHQRVKISTHAMDDVVNLSDENGVFPIHGLSMSPDHKLYAMGQTVSEGVNTLYEIKLDEETHVVNAKETAFKDVEASAFSAPCFIDEDRFMFIGQQGYMNYLCEGDASTGKAKLVTSLLFAPSALGYDEDSGWLYLNDSKTGGLYAYSVEHGGDLVHLLEKGSYDGNCKVIYPGDAEDGDLPEEVEDDAPGKDEVVFTPLYVEVESGFKAAAFVASENLFYAFNDNNELWAFQPGESGDSVKVGDITGFDEGLTPNSLASNGEDLVLLATGETLSKGYKIDLEKGKLDGELFTYNGKAYTLCGIGNDQFAFVTTTGTKTYKKIMKVSGSDVNDWTTKTNLNVTDAEKAPFMVYGPTHPNIRLQKWGEDFSEKILYHYQGRTRKSNTTLSAIDPVKEGGYYRTSLSSSGDKMVYKVNTDQKLIGLFVNYGGVTPGVLPATADISASVPAKVYAFHTDGWRVGTVANGAETQVERYVLAQGETPATLGPVTYVPEKGLFYTVDGGGLLRAFQPSNETASVAVSWTPVAQQLTGAQGEVSVTDIAYNPADHKTYILVTAGGQSHLAELNLDTGAAAVTSTFGRTMNRVTFLTDGAAILADTAGKLWKVVDGVETALETDVTARALAWSAGENLLYLIRSDGSLCTLNLVSCEVKTIVESDYGVYRALLVTGGGYQTLALPAEGARPETTPEPSETPEVGETPEPTPVPELKDRITDEMLKGVQRPSEDAWYAQAQPGKVTAETLTLRKAPADEAEAVENVTLNSGADVEILAKEGDWLLVKAAVEGADVYGWTKADTVADSGLLLAPVVGTPAPSEEPEEPAPAPVPEEESPEPGDGEAPAPGESAEPTAEPAEPPVPEGTEPTAEPAEPPVPEGTEPPAEDGGGQGDEAPAPSPEEGPVE